MKPGIKTDTLTIKKKKKQKKKHKKKQMKKKQKKKKKTSLLDTFRPSLKCAYLLVVLGYIVLFIPQGVREAKRKNGND